MRKQTMWCFCLPFISDRNELPRGDNADFTVYPALRGERIVSSLFFTLCKHNTYVAWSQPTWT